MSGQAVGLIGESFHCGFRKKPGDSSKGNGQDDAFPLEQGSVGSMAWLKIAGPAFVKISLIGVVDEIVQLFIARRCLSGEFCQDIRTNPDQITGLGLVSFGHFLAGYLAPVGSWLLAGEQNYIPDKLPPVVS